MGRVTDNYGPVMYRGATRTGELARALRDLGVSVEKRQLETWSQRGLLPRPGTPKAKLLAHIEEIAKVHRSGPGAPDRTMLVLAARGFACSGLSAAVTRVWSASSSKSLKALANDAAAGLPDPEADEGSWDIEKQVERLLGLASVRGVPRPLREALSDIANAIANEAKQRPAIDLATGQPHSPMNTVFNVLVEIVVAGYGRSPLDPDAIRVLGNGLFGEDRELTRRGKQMIEAVSSRISTEPLNVLATFSAITDDDLVCGAQAMCALLSGIPALTSFRDPERHERLEYLAGALSPVGIATRTLLRESAGDRPEPS